MADRSNFRSLPFWIWLFIYIFRSVRVEIDREEILGLDKKISWLDWRSCIYVFFCDLRVSSCLGSMDESLEVRIFFFCILLAIWDLRFWDSDWLEVIWESMICLRVYIFWYLAFDAEIWSYISCSITNSEISRPSIVILSINISFWENRLARELGLVWVMDVYILRSSDICLWKFVLWVSLFFLAAMVHLISLARPASSSLILSISSRPNIFLKIFSLLASCIVKISSLSCINILRLVKTSRSGKNSCKWLFRSVSFLKSMGDRSLMFIYWSNHFTLEINSFGRFLYILWVFSDVLDLDIYSLDLVDSETLEEFAVLVAVAVILRCIIYSSFSTENIIYISASLHFALTIFLSQCL